MNLQQRIKAFDRLGQLLRAFTAEYHRQGTHRDSRLSWLHEKVRQANEQNPWFTEHHILTALRSIGAQLSQNQLERWTQGYAQLKQPNYPSQVIGVVAAGNIPLVGFHDFLSVLMAGHTYQGKLSSRDKILPEALARLLGDIEPGFNKHIDLREDQLHDFDAIIATGSNNTSRYFHYYFGKYPHIIRHNRNGAAVLTGGESNEQLKKLADDILLFFGLGCRNISKLYVPESFEMERIMNNLEHYRHITDNSKYANNYDYQKSVFLINQMPHYDTGFLLLKEDQRLASPLATLHFERYRRLAQVKQSLAGQQDQIQCIVSVSDEFPRAVAPGQAQYPKLWEYADGIDTLAFLTGLKTPRS